MIGSEVSLLFWKYLCALILATSLTVVISTMFSVDVHDKVITNICFVILLVTLAWSLCDGDFNRSALILSFIPYGAICCGMMIFALAHWDWPIFWIRLFAGPFERVGFYPPDGEGWFPFGAFLWFVSTFFLALMAFGVASLVGNRHNPSL